MTIKRIPILIALVLTLNFGFAQKYFPGSIIKINGDTIKCYIRIPKYADDKTVDYRNSEKSFERTIKSDSVRLIAIQTKGGAINTLERIQLTKKSKGFVILLIEGYVSLYVAGEGISANKDGEFAPNTSYFSGRDLPTFNYLAIRKSEKVATILAVTSSSPTAFGQNNTFRVFASKYFADYPELVKRIDKKEFSHDDVEKVVKIYNKHMEENQKK
jgi:hypothetical protein